MQFVQVKFSPESGTAYTYHNDGEPVAVGDNVQVERHGKWLTLPVYAVTDVEPTFVTRPIRPVPTEPTEREDDETQDAAEAEDDGDD